MGQQILTSLIQQKSYMINSSGRFYSTATFEGRKASARVGVEQNLSFVQTFLGSTTTSTLSNNSGKYSSTASWHCRKREVNKELQKQKKLTKLKGKLKVKPLQHIPQFSCTTQKGNFEF